MLKVMFVCFIISPYLDLESNAIFAIEFMIAGGGVLSTLALNELDLLKRSIKVLKKMHWGQGLGYVKFVKLQLPIIIIHSRI